MAESEPTTEETPPEEESRDPNPGRDLEVDDKTPEYKNDNEGEEQGPEIDKKPTEKDSESQNTIKGELAERYSVKEEALIQTHNETTGKIEGRDFIQNGVSIIEAIKNSELNQDEKDRLLAGYDKMLDFFSNNPDKIYVLDEREREIDGRKFMEMSGITLDKDGTTRLESWSAEIKEKEEEPTEEDPIDKIEGVKVETDTLNLEKDIDKEKDENTDKEVTVNTPLFVETETAAEETIEQVQAITQEEVGLIKPEANNLNIEATPTITAEREDAEPNAISSEKPSTQDSIHVIEQPPTQTTEKVDEQMTITEKILELLKDEPVIKNKTPDILEEPKEDREKIKVAETQISTTETISQAPRAQEQIAPVDIKVAENIKALLPEIKTVNNAKIEAIKSETITRQPEAKAVHQPKTETSEIVESANKGVVSPYIEIRTTFKAEIKDTEKKEVEQEVLVHSSEKTAVEAAVIETPDVPANTVIDTAKTEQEIYTETEETSKKEQIVQVVQPETIEEIQTDQTTEPELVSAAIEDEKQVVIEEAKTDTPEKAIDEVTTETPIEISRTSSEIEIKNEAPEVIENVKIETIEIIQNPAKEAEPEKMETIVSSVKKTNKTETITVNPSVSEINNKAKSAEVIDIQSVTAEKTLPVDEKTEKDFAIDGHEMFLHILGLPLTKTEPNRNESIQTRSIPYSAVEPDSTDTKTTGNRPEVINTLNGITLKGLKRAA